MRKSFRRRLAMPRFEDPVELRRENSLRAGLAPGRWAQLRERRLVAWPTTPHATLPARPSSKFETSPGMPTAAVLADIVYASRKARSYEEALSTALLIAREHELRRSFGPPYEEYEDDPILR